MQVTKDGVEIKKSFVSSSVVESIKSEVSASNEDIAQSGIRSAEKKFKSIKELVESTSFISLAKSILGSTPKKVRVIYFDKTPDKNWSVTWHQDKTVAVNKKLKIKDWKVWSIKDGIHHVQPPVEVLNKMVTFRLHLDDADKNNGCLKVIKQSHHLGLLSHTELTEVVKNHEPFLCEVNAGDLVIMKPHIIHSSNKSVEPKHRRVVHVEYSNYALPSNLKWA